MDSLPLFLSRHRDLVPDFGVLFLVFPDTNSTELSSPRLILFLASPDLVPPCSHGACPALSCNIVHLPVPLLGGVALSCGAYLSL
ncbi:Zinc finger protein 76 [Fusarium oxysporum f. sp. albedinis]|nr:Zinc finger protein 76 [Fusarium oxysporum f. sp. albedinis]